MGYACYLDTKWQRDAGYGVPAYCDHPKCNAEIDRGVSYACGKPQGGGEYGCGLSFCSKHRYYRPRLGVETCQRCKNYNLPYKPKPDHPQWLAWKLKDESWADWRAEHPEQVKEMRLICEAA